MNKRNALLRQFLFCLLIVVLACGLAPGQDNTKWLAAGSFHNWYSDIGSEIEHGLYASQQYGFRWPAIYNYQDMQAAKGMWIGVRGFTDAKNTFYEHKVVHVGPRVRGSNELFPVKFEMVSRFEPPEVYVDGNRSQGEALTYNDRVDPNMKPDRMIVSVINSQVGITLTRKIMQFSQDYHDNYHLMEYTFTNTGNTDADDEIEMPAVTLNDVYFFFQYRMAVCREPRYVIGNGTGWGMNTMIDTRGDGVKADPATEQFRAQYFWHGKFPPFTTYDNVGAPVWDPSTSYSYIDKTDTTGRLAAAQFAGILTLYADKSAAEKIDDLDQPSTTMYQSSDDPLESNNDAYNTVKMTQEYGWMTYGHMSPRHADKVEPAGKFTEPTGDPALGTQGGFSAFNGYGPYNLKPGESIRIVLAEGAAGLSRAKCIEVGRQYKQKQITAKQKNEWVMTSRDSLFQTFRRITANYAAGYDIPRPPLPPKQLFVNGLGDRIELTWDIYANGTENLSGFEIYRAMGRYDSTYTLIASVGPNERVYNDKNLERGPSYYYYIVSVGNASANNGAGLTKPGALRSSRYYTQTYDPATLKRPAGTSLSQIRVVPNPFSLGADANQLRFPDEPDKIGFFDIPGLCTIKIFTENGELIKTIEHTDDTGDAYWNCTTSSNQIVVTGIYIAVVTDNRTGENHIVKFVIIR